VIIFEQFLLERLPRYYSDSTLTFLAAAISISSIVPYIGHRDAITNFLGTEHAERVDSMSLWLCSFFDSWYGRRNAYKEFLSGFLTTEARSGHCFLNGQCYSTAAQQCLNYLHKDRCYTPGTHDGMHCLLTKWVLECLPIFLDQSIRTEALVQAAQCMEFNDIVGQFHEEEFMAKAAIARYLSRSRGFAK